MKGEVALHQAVLDAGTDQLAMLVASHPDDQYLHPATILRFRHGWRVAVVLLTRGEGGQNISGSETGDALAARRTRETERCAARLGIEIHFLDKTDNGFCRSAEEALDVWGRVGTTNDLARLIRSLRPDVVWTTHHPGEEHGHDLALLRILPEAVDRAASSLYRWDGLLPYRVRCALRACSPGEDSSIELPGDGVEPVRGETYRRLAYQALAEHRSQAPFRPMDEIYPEVLRLRPLHANDTPATGLFDADTDLFSELGAAHSSPHEVTALRTALERELPALVANRRELLQRALGVRSDLMRMLTGDSTDLRRRAVRRTEALDAVIVHSLSLTVEATPHEHTVAVIGEALPVRVSVLLGQVRNLDRVRLRVPEAGTFEDSPVVDLGALSTGGKIEHALALRVANHEARLAAPASPAAHLLLELELAEQRVTWPVPIAVEVRPALEARAIRPDVLWPHDRRETPIAVRVTNHLTATAKGSLLTRAPVGWSIDPSSLDVEIVPGATRIFTFGVVAPPDVKPGVSTLRVNFQDAVAEFAIHTIDVTIAPSLRVGLVPGVDDTSRRVLEGLGVELHVLDDDDLATFPLRSLDTVLVDIRALRTQPTARAAFARLLEFVESGGRLVVLYHKDKEWEAPGFVGSPFPMRLGRGRVTQEDAPVRVLRADHVLLMSPNRIAARDWDGWVQERGLYFAEDYDARYEEIIAAADAGQAELRGGLLYARHGAGDYVYCALAFFRQLKKLHPGAARLFANLITPVPRGR